MGSMFAPSTRKADAARERAEMLQKRQAAKIAKKEANEKQIEGARLASMLSGGTSGTLYNNDYLGVKNTDSLGTRRA